MRSCPAFLSLEAEMSQGLACLELASCSCFTWLSACLKLCLLYSLVPARCPGRWTSSCESLGTPECSFVLLTVRVTSLECPEIVPRNHTKNISLSVVLFPVASRGRLNGSELKALPSCCCLCLCPRRLSTSSQSLSLLNAVL